MTDIAVFNPPVGKPKSCMYTAPKDSKFVTTTLSLRSTNDLTRMLSIILLIFSWSFALQYWHTIPYLKKYRPEGISMVLILNRLRTHLVQVVFVTQRVWRMFQLYVHISSINLDAVLCLLSCCISHSM